LGSAQTGIPRRCSQIPPCSKNASGGWPRPSDPSPPTRITLTYPALESSRHVAFLVAGKEKREIFSRFQRGEHTLPAARLRPIGTLHLFADAAAARDMPP